MTITEFLLARIEEDEKVARERPNSAQIHYSGCYYYNYSLDAGWECDCDEDGEGTARLLAECAAKRAIIAEYDGLTFEQRKTFDSWEPYRSVMRNVLVQMASVYASHPDYREEWAL